MTDARLYAPAAQRNRDVIRDHLRPLLPAAGVVLEVASGSGEHIVHLAASFPHLTFQPTDRDPAARASIDAWVSHVGFSNVRPARALDATAASWPVTRADVVLCVNMIHIAPWAATEGLLHHAGQVLPAGGVLVLYGPFNRDGVPFAPSNAAFDADLRRRDPSWGIRRLAAVTACAKGFAPPEVIEMPANNLLVAYRRLPL